MANIRIIKNRIKSAKNIAQITKAMELVAASKMKKAQATALAGKLYAQKIYDMVMELAQTVEVGSHPLLTKPATISGKRLVILITTNKGLAGSLNGNVFRFLLKEYPKPEMAHFITLGRKGADLLSRMGRTLVADFSTTVPFSSAAPAVIELATREFTAHRYDGVDIVYSEFFSALTQKPRLKTIMPLTLDIPKVEAPTQAKASEFLIEPSRQEVFNLLLPHYVENQIRDAVLQAEASEHSARMVAMRNATDNALSLMDGLTVLYNKARQEKITYEISDMVTARMTVE
jgi:F-type H+-transporting ATPase subunit gamma